MSDEELRAELGSLPADLRVRLELAGFDAARFMEIAAPVLARARGAIMAPASETNRVRGMVELPRESDIVDAPTAETPMFERHAESGRDALAHGRVAICVMAGGMATRMGGVVKALLDVLPQKTFLDLRLVENAAWSAHSVRPVPLWLMTSHATDGAIREALDRRGTGPHVATFTQNLALRLTREGRLFRTNDGIPSPYATGHGDLPDALRRSGLLNRFVDRGGQFVWIANIDNVGATIDPALLGWFVEQRIDAMVELAPKRAGDRGGIPAWAETARPGMKPARRLQVIEEFRLPEGFDAASVRVFNTNTMLVRADALLRAPLHWTWFEVQKLVEGRAAIQFERLLQEITATLPTAYVRVPRDGADSRFIPIKGFDDLTAYRDLVETVVRARGLV
ncbi:MAG: UTP--glucose-1-phosphate uridylyltransferase [Polyangiaceae bacterium]|jgi:UTP--glucose-1-phosphate uridylyltransferase